MTVDFSNVPDVDTQVRGEIVFEDMPSSHELERFRALSKDWGKKGKVVLSAGNLNEPALAFVGGGKKGRFSNVTLRSVTADFVRLCTAHSFTRLSLALSVIDSAQDFSWASSSAVAEGVIAGNYRFEKYLGEARKATALESFALVGGDMDGLMRGHVLGEAESYVKNIGNEPGNVINPLTFELIATQLSGKFDLDCHVYGESEIIELGMNALWHVGKGSTTPPRLVHLTYKPKEVEARKRIAIVGKGVTFDSGGLCVKTQGKMKNMKLDKSGACVMLGVMRAASALKLPVELHGIAGLVENMPDGSSYRPGDVIRAMNGKTIEVQDTDAEGRLTLADVLTFASRVEPDVIIDVATLTGSVSTALGNYTAALMCEDDALSEALLKSSVTAGERLHRLPMDDELLYEGLRGDHGDLRQASPDGGGAISAGMFLREFVDGAKPWAHIDMASTAWYDREFGVYTKGCSAYSMRTIVEYLSGL